MTFVWHEDCDVDDTFVRDAATRRPSVANRNWNCVVVVVALVHNLDSVMPADPYRCRNILDRATTVTNHKI